jgi:hypothetical protein
MPQFRKDMYTKKGVTLSDYTFFDNALKSVYFIPSAP